MSLHSARTVGELFWERVELSRERTALWIKASGKFQPRAWNQLAGDVLRLSQLLKGWGIAAGDRVVQIADNRYEWIMADLAIHTLGAVHVPVHPTLSGEQMSFQIQDSGARLVCFGGHEVAVKLAAVEPFPHEEIQFASYDSGNPPIHGAVVHDMASLLEGMPPREPPEPAGIGADDLATILYTSGTTGEPKGVMLSHGNLVSNSLGVLEVMEHAEDDVRLAFLPLSHIFARTCDLYTWIAAGSQLAQAESRQSVLEDAALVQPTVLNGVPFFFERVAKVAGDLERAGKPREETLRKLLGGKLHYACSGGAALPTELYDFYTERGVTLLQGYGLTESSPVITVSTLTANRRGAVGCPLPQVEVRIDDDGEILTRGPHVMQGYYRRPAATDEAIRDGWLYTGDLGRLDEDGFLYVTGRKKEIIVTSAGKNISPVLIESLLTQDPLIHQAMVVGDDRKCLGALIVPHVDHLREIVAVGEWQQADREDILANPAVLEMYANCIRDRLAKLSRHEQVVHFRLLPRPFGIEWGELTPKLSLRREVIQQHFAAEIDAMYIE
jgi:long-chain acyl-CoA synthetase